MARAVKVRIPSDLAEALNTEAARLEVPMPWLVARILREHVTAHRAPLPPLPDPAPVTEGGHFRRRREPPEPEHDPSRGRG